MEGIGGKRRIKETVCEGVKVRSERKTKRKSKELKESYMRGERVMSRKERGKRKT